MEYSVFKEKPENFQVHFEASGCFCYSGKKILFLRRNPEKPQGNTWGVPGGKLEKNETPKMAVIREVYEEVGLNINDERLEIIDKIYCKLPDMNFTYHMFRVEFEVIPEIDLCFEEHVEFTWVTAEEALSLPLIAGGEEALSYYTQSLSSPLRNFSLSH